MDSFERFRTLDLGDWHKIERRIGIRVPTDGIEVQWVPGADNPHDERRLARLVEVSVTGAAIDASSGPQVQLSSEVKLRFGGTDSTVTVRHVTPTGSPEVCRYGVEWGRLEEPLREVVYGAVADARPVTA